MPYKDALKQKEYQGQWQRQRWASETERFRVMRFSSPEEIMTANTLLSVLAGLIKEVLESKEGDVFIRSRTVGYLISIGLKAVHYSTISWTCFRQHFQRDHFYGRIRFLFASATSNFLVRF